MAEQYMFVSSEKVEPGESIAIQKPVVRPFRGEKLVVSDASMGFEIESLVIDGKEYFQIGRSKKAIPAVAFASNSLGNGLCLPAAHNNIQLSARNISTSPCEFKAWLLGNSHEDRRPQ